MGKVRAEQRIPAQLPGPTTGPATTGSATSGPTTVPPTTVTSSAVPSTGAALVTRNIVSMLGARAVLAVVALVSVPVIYNHLGATEFGIWALLTGMATVVALADLGLGSAIVRQVASNIHGSSSERSRVALGLGLIWGVLIALLAGALTVLTWPWLSEVLNLGAVDRTARSAALVLVAAILLDGIAMPWRAVLEGTQRYLAVSWVTAGTAVLGGVLAVVVVVGGGGMLGLAASVAVTSAARLILVGLIARRAVAAMSPSFAGINRDHLRTLGSYGIRVQITNASGAVNMELDRFVLSGFFGPAVAGGFDLGGRLVNLLRLPPTFALMAMFPMAVRKHAQAGTDWLDRFNLAATKYLAAFSAIGAACLVTCADPLVRAWLGQPNWWAAVNIAILAPAYAVNLAAGATGIVTRVEGRPGRETGYAVLSIVVNLVLTWPLLLLLGPAGVPLATAVGVVVSTVYFLGAYHRVTGRPIAPMRRAISTPVLAAVVGGCAAGLLLPILPDGADRWGAIVAVLCRGSVVLAVSVTVLSCSGFLTARDRAGIQTFLRRAVVRSRARSSR